MEDVVAAVVLPGPLQGDDVPGIGHHADQAGVPLVAAADGAGAVPLGEVPADGTQGNGRLGGNDGVGKLPGVLLRQVENEKGQPLGGLGADARQTGELLREPLQGGGKILHGSGYLQTDRDDGPLSLGGRRSWRRGRPPRRPPSRPPARWRQPR